MQYSALSRFALLLPLFFLSGCAGQRLLHVQIERDGQVVLECGYGVSDRLGKTAIWQSIDGRSFEAIDTVTPTAEDPQRAVLKGKVRLVILHAGREIAVARLEELRLVRVPGTADKWQLPPEEVQRTARAAGL